MAVRKPDNDGPKVKTVMKGAEKRAVDAFNSLKGSAEKTILNSVKMPIRSAQKPVEEAMSGGMQKSKEYKITKKMFTLGTTVGVSIIATAALNSSNESAINRINKGKGITSENANNCLTFGTLKDAHNELYALGITKQEEFKLRNEKDIKRLSEEIDIYGSKIKCMDASGKAYKLGKLSRMSDDKLSRLYDNANTINDTTQMTLIRAEQLLRKSDNVKFDMRKNMLKSSKYNRKIKAHTIGVLNSTISDTDFYHGYGKLRETKMLASSVYKGVEFEYRNLTVMVYKGTRLVGRNVSKGIQYGLNKTGNVYAKKTAEQLGKFSSNTGKVLDKAENVVSTVYHAPKNMVNAAKTGAHNTRIIVNDRIRNSPEIAGRAVNRLKQTSKYKKVRKKIRSSKVGKRVRVVSYRTNRVIKKVAASKVGRAAKTTGKVVGKTAKFGSKIVSLPMKGAKILSKGIYKLISLIKGIIVKAVLGIVGLVLVVVIISGVLSSIIGAISTVGDAVKNSYTEFVTDTTMGATYKKLLEKEAKFSAAIENESISQKVPQELTNQYGITQYTSQNVNYLNGDGQQLENSSTIKGILSMAAIYIEQDFDKYGSAFDGVFADSTYKDYCAKLYDATHLIGIGDPSEVYYCKGETENSISDTCNNHSVAGKMVKEYSDDTRLISDAEALKASILYNYEKGDHEYSQIITKCGPHGISQEFSKDDDKEDKKEIENEFKKICPNAKRITTYHCSEKDNKETDYVFVCGCPQCNGHVDANVYVFVSNIYDPSLDEEEVTSDDGTITKKDSYDNIDKEHVETKYNMYVLDKYATAFDAPTSDTASVYCSNVNCEHSLLFNEYASPVTISKDNPVCPTCNTTLVMPGSKHPGDEESYDEAKGKELYAAEREILKDITGQDNIILDDKWWDNDGWWESNVSTNETYFRLLDQSSGNIDELPKSELEDDKNVVNKTNSTPYKFRSFTSKSGRNTEFEKHGWDEDSIAQVRLLMSADWSELYGISDFGYVTGTALTDAQIAQLISNNVAWKDLCDDRKQIMYICTEMQSLVGKYGIRYHLGGGCTTAGVESIPGHLNNACINGDGGGPGFDCSRFVCWVLSTASGGQYPAQGSTDTIHGWIGSKLEPVTGSLLPGDIALRYKSGGTNGGGNHVMIYTGLDANGNMTFCDFRSHKSGYKYCSTYGSMSGYSFYRPTFIDEDSYTLSEEESENDDQNQNNE